MKLELFIFGITGFFIYNAYHDNKYSKLLLSYKKYYQIAFIGFIALSIYLLIKRNPLQSKNLLLYANNMVKYMPLDKSSVDLISPIFDMSSGGNRSFMENYNSTMNPSEPQHLISQQQRNILSGPKATKRSVSETKKKYVASMQDWKCGQCTNKLTHTFEVDHKIRLEHGGSNDVTNLVALCRECHGQKTALENM
uniref:HNH nuclease domain-containing protein n=1 Tax=viral metagenome TaxID=1070528 RepID=A0A6C0ITZ5_9ZZZZ